MALKSDSLGSLLQGVSQQPDRVRLDGQVSTQTNLVSDVTDGLNTRATTDLLADLESPLVEDAEYTDVTFQGKTYIVGYKDRSIRFYDLMGTRVPASLRNGALADYFSQDMKFHVVDDKIVALNREATVAVDSTVTPPAYYTAIFHALGGQFLKTYEVNIKFSNSTELTASFTTPDGTGTGDAEQTNSENIAEELYNEILAHPNLPAGSILQIKFDVVYITHPTLSMDITVSDGVGGEILRAVSDKVDSVSDLPRFAPNGTIVKVVSSEATEDDFWLKFVADNESVENGQAGFGNEGTWIEWYDPTEERNFDLSTMPHVIVEEDGDLFIEPGPWLGRSVGNSDSSPFPSFVGKQIRDINGFESRLAMISNDTLVMSRTNEPFDLFRETATGVSSSDPIDITSTKKDDLTLDWIVPFDRDLFIFADPGDSQFVIRGGGLTPSNASMVLTTEFEVSSAGAVPSSTGRTILFPFTVGKYSGIKEFYTNTENAVNAANTLTETQDKYLVGQVSRIAISQNFNTAAFLTTDAETVLTMYKYLWDNDELLQSAWYRWVFRDTIKHVFFVDNALYLVSQTGSNVYLHTLNLNKPTNAYGFHTMLDRQEEVTVGTDRTVTMPYLGAKFMQDVGCAYPGYEIMPQTVITEGTQFRYVFGSDAPVGATLQCGHGVKWVLEPTEVFAKDYQGRVDTSRKVTVQDYVIHVYQSGDFNAVLTSPYRPAYVFEHNLFPLDNEPEFTADQLFTGPVYIPWGERADWSKLTLYGDSIRPVTIHEVEWIGQILKSRGRR